MTPLILAVTMMSVQPAAPAPECRLPRASPTAQPGAPPRSRRLADMPDANAIRAVLRTVDGCQYQDVIRYQVGKAGPTYPPGTLAPVQDRVTKAEPTAR